MRVILSDKEILKLQGGETPLITPFDDCRLRGASYDVLLDNEITPLRESAGIIDLSDQTSIDSVYQQQLKADGFVLKPGQYCLAALAESITLPDDVVAYVVPRTRFTRLGLIVADQFCNPSYSGRLRIGLYNASGNNLRLASYLSVAQLVFVRLDTTPSAERLYRNQESAAYHGETSFVGSQMESSSLSPKDRELYDALMQELLGES